MSSVDAVKAALKDTIKQSTEAAAKKGITEATGDAIQKSLQDSLRNTALDGSQKAIKDALEKNTGLEKALDDGNKNLRGNIKNPDNLPKLRDEVFKKLDPKLQKGLLPTSPNFVKAVDDSINEIDFGPSLKSYADKPKMGKLGSDGDFKVSDTNASSIKKKANDLQDELDADPEYKQKSVAERDADFKDLESGKKDLGKGDNIDNNKLKKATKDQGRGLFRSSVKAAGLAIAGVAFFAWANKRAESINNWNGRCSSITKQGNDLIFKVDDVFPETADCKGRKFFIRFTTTGLINFSGPNDTTFNINSCVNTPSPGTEDIIAVDSQNLRYARDKCPDCLKNGFSDKPDGVYTLTNPSGSIFLKCETTTAIEAGCIIKEYGLKPIDDLFGGLGLNLGKIIRTILIVIAVVILAIVIFKIVGYIKNRD